MTSWFVYSSLSPQIIDQETYHKFRKAFYGSTKQDVIINLDIEEITNIFSKHDIDHIFLKGSLLKQLYPESYMRTMGDIDILVKDSDLEKAKSVLLSNGFTTYITTPVHECFFSKRKTLIEIHCELSEKTERFMKFLNKTWKETFNLYLSRFELNYEYNLVYLLIHLVKHLNSSGIGIRSVLDIGIFVNHYKDSINKDKLKQFLSECDLELFYNNMLWLNQKCFGFDFTEFLNGFSQGENFYQEVTDFILISGVHGFGKDFNRFTSQITHHARNNQNIRKGRIKHFFKIIFPGRKTMQSTYHYLKKFPFLLPLAWFSRFLRLIFKQTKRSLHKLKKLLFERKSIEETISLYDELGV